MDELTIREIENTKEASDRGRWVLLVMQIASILIFIASWHEMNDGWSYSRVAVLKAAVWLLDCSNDKHIELEGTGTASELAKMRHDECHYIESNRKGCKRTALQPFCPAELALAREYVAAGLLTPGEVRKELETAHISNSDRIINVSVPFLGITFDVNDLGLLGGITFTLLLIWLAFSLKREAANIAITFKKEGDNLLSAYTLLSMTQVLTITPEAKIGQNNFVKLLWLLMERVLLFSPVMVQAWVVCTDYSTLDFARAVNPHWALVEFFAECFLLVVILSLTVNCVLKTHSIDRKWKDAYKRLPKSPMSSVQKA